MSPSTKTTAAVSVTNAKVKGDDAVKNNHVNEAQTEKAGASDDEEEVEEETTKSKAEQNTAMNKLTDHVEEKQMDEGKMKAAFLELRKQEDADKEAERKREKQLAAVKVNKEDVDLIVREMELTTQQADRKLREAGGNVVACLTALIG